ncbi:transcriptional repressor [bacterium]|nr:transcriptional repressor [bacterium]
MNMLTDWISKLNQAGVRATPQRIAVLRTLRGSKQHPTASAIYDTVRSQFPNISQATVYKTLDLLVDLGMASKVGQAGGGQIHYDGDTTPHFHFSCIDCHKVIDIENEGAQHLVADIQTKSQFEMYYSKLVYYGLCPDCQ